MELVAILLKVTVELFLIQLVGLRQLHLALSDGGKELFIVVVDGLVLIQIQVVSEDLQVLFYVENVIVDGL